MQVAQAGTSSGQTSAGGSSWHLWAKGSFSFHDVLDAINPLQHLPIVSTIYREVTGDKIGNAARVAGDSLYGGVIGLAVGLVNAMSVSDTGKDLGERAIAMIGGDSDSAETAEKSTSGKSYDTPKGSVTVETIAFQPPSTVPAQYTDARAVAAVVPAVPGTAKSLSMAAALAALPNRPPVDLPFFPGGAVDSTGGQPPQSIARPASSPVAEAKPVAINLESQPHGIAIDTSSAGIMAMRAKGHGSAPIPLQVSPGAFLAQNSPANGNSAASAAVVTSQNMTVPGHKDDNSNDFVIRMRQGIEKYNALLAKQSAAGRAGESGTMQIDTGTPAAAGTADAARLLN